VQHVSAETYVYLVCCPSCDIVQSMLNEAVMVDLTYGHIFSGTYVNAVHHGENNVFLLFEKLFLWIS